MCVFLVLVNGNYAIAAALALLCFVPCGLIQIDGILSLLKPAQSLH